MSFAVPSTSNVSLNAGDPGVTDDVDSHNDGDLWVNTTAGTIFILLDGTDGAAVWQKIGSEVELKRGKKLVFNSDFGSDSHLRQRDSVTIRLEIEGVVLWDADTTYSFRPQTTSIHKDNVASLFGSTGETAIWHNGTNLQIETKAGGSGLPTSDPADGKGTLWTDGGTVKVGT